MSEFSAEPGGDGDAKTEAAARDALFDVLADKQRRTAIEYLAVESGTVSVDDLVDSVIAMADSAEGTPGSRKQTESRFHHVHLPKLDTAGLINYDPDERLVTPTQTISLARQLVDQAADVHPP